MTNPTEFLSLAQSYDSHLTFSKPVALDHMEVDSAGAKFYHIAFSCTHRSLYDTIFDACTPAMMYRLGRVGQLSYAALKDYMKRAFDINKHFARFFTNPSSFRLLQAQTDCVVSGSNALQFLNRKIYPESDLDIYVDVWKARRVCKWIVNSGDPHRAYSFRPTPGQPDNFMDAWEAIVREAEGFEHIVPVYGMHNAASATGLYKVNRVLAVFNFASSDLENDRCRKIQVVVTDVSPLMSLLTFHSTVVMNAITHKAAYSLFPKATFEEKTTLFTAIRETKHEYAIKKYIDRGWKLVKSITQEVQRNKRSAFRYGKRWVTDNKSWVFPLDTSGLGRDDDHFANGSFNLHCRIDDMMPEMRFTSIKDSTLENSYVLNLETGAKVKAYINLCEETPETVSEQAITRFNEICRVHCGCRVNDFTPIHDQILQCSAFRHMVSEWPTLGQLERGGNMKRLV